jgi:hypothetical protein
MTKPDPTLETTRHLSAKRGPAPEDHRINIELSLDLPKDVERQIAELNLDEADAERLRELAGKSAALKEKLATNPVLAREFSEDPVTVFAREFKEVEIPIRKDRRLLDDRFRVRLQPNEPQAPTDGALEVLRNTLVYVASSVANADAFEADPLGTLRTVNGNRLAPDVARAEAALEQVLGIYRIQRIPVDLYQRAPQVGILQRPR